MQHASPAGISFVAAAVAGAAIALLGCGSADRSGASSSAATKPLTSPDGAATTTAPDTIPDGGLGDGVEAGPILTQNPCIEAGTCTPPVNCSGLSSVVGAWHNVAPAPFVSPPNMETYVVAVNPEDESVFAAAGNVTNGAACPSGTTCKSGGSGIYKSTDCGSTWQRVSSTAAGSGAANLLTGASWALLIDPVVPQTMYVANGYGNQPTIYKSINGGVDWTALNPDPTHLTNPSTPFVQAIAIDPFNHMHLGLTFHENCAAPYNPLCFSQSSDGGNTWKVFNGPSSIPNWSIKGWMEGASLSILGASSYLFTAGAGVWYTADGGAHWTQVVAQYVSGSYSGTNHIAPDGTLYIGANNVFFSPPNSMTTPPFGLATGTTPSVTSIAHSPSVTVLIDDGVNLYGSLTPGQNMQPFWTATLAAPTVWTAMPDTACDNGTCRGSNQMAYDSVHHIVYSANWGAGLWRLVTR